MGYLDCPKFVIQTKAASAGLFCSTKIRNPMCSHVWENCVWNFYMYNIFLQTAISTGSVTTMTAQNLSYKQKQRPQDYFVPQKLETRCVLTYERIAYEIFICTISSCKQRYPQDQSHSSLKVWKSDFTLCKRPTS